MYSHSCARTPYPRVNAHTHLAAHDHLATDDDTLATLVRESK